MRYDFDMFSIIPDEVQAQFQGMINDLGVTGMMGEQRALWRDPAVVEALHGADQVVKDLFLESGFGINHYTSGAPDGRFLKRDEPAWLRCQERFLDLLTEGLQDGSLKDANWNGFDLRAFLLHLEAAEPIDEIEVQDHFQQQMHVSSKMKRQRSMARIGLALGIAAICYVAANFLGSSTVIAAL